MLIADIPRPRRPQKRPCPLPLLDTLHRIHSGCSFYSLSHHQETIPVTRHPFRRDDCRYYTRQLHECADHHISLAGGIRSREATGRPSPLGLACCSCYTRSGSCGRCRHSTTPLGSKLEALRQPLEWEAGGISLRAAIVNDSHHPFMAQHVRHPTSASPAVSGAGPHLDCNLCRGRRAASQYPVL